MKKVVFIGINNVLDRFANRLATKANVVAVTNARFESVEKTIPQIILKPHLFFIPWKWLQGFGQLSLPYFFYGLQRVLDQEKPDVIIVMEYLRGWTLQALFYTLRHPTVKLFIHVETKRSPRGLFGRVYLYGTLKILHFFSSHINAILTYTEQASRWNRSKLPLVRVELLPVPIDPRLFSYKARSYMEDGVLRIYCNARAVPFKRHGDLLEALVLLETENRDIRYSVTFIGEGPLKQLIRERVRALGLEKKCTFLPPVPLTKIPDVLLKHDVLVLMSDNEAFGIVVPEAMVSGLSTITSDTVGANVYVIPGKTGFIYKTGDCRALKDAIVAIAHKDKVSEMGKASAVQMETNFQWDACLQNFNNVVLK